MIIHDFKFALQTRKCWRHSLLSVMLNKGKLTYLEI